MNNRLFASMLLAVGSAMSTGSIALATTPTCDQPLIVNTVIHRFAANSRNFRQSDLEITDFGHIHESRFLPVDKTWPVERRYCSTRITTNDGARRQLWYLIENNWGFAGMGPSVEFCVSGLDRWHVYGAYCRSLR